MKPAGIILTFMKWFSKWFLFNLGLFTWQLTFMVIGTVYGKIKWPKSALWTRIVCIAGMGTAIAAMVSAIMGGTWPLLPVNIISFIILFATYRGIDWCKVWHAAQVCHVRLCLLPIVDTDQWEYINFGYPKAELQYWRMDMIDGKRWGYYDPTFDPSDEFIKAMQQYAYDQVGKSYDVPQLASYALNLAIWIVCPWTWGREVKRWFNRPGGCESCASGVTADLRWGEKKEALVMLKRIHLDEISGYRIRRSKFFTGYDTAMVPPCLYELSKNRRER